jgi:ornithine cyclodeaminase/alanine dehydrogenase
VKKISFRYLNQDDVLSLNIALDDILLVTEKALKEHARKAFEMPPKPGIHPLPGTFIHAMPAFLSDLKIAGLKWVSGFPENWKTSLPTIIGLLILNDSKTGLPLCVMDATWLTAIRTAAVSGVAVKYLLREHSRVLGIVGAGTQGRYNTGMIKHICPSIKEVIAFDINREQLDKLQSHVQDTYGLAVKFAPDPKTVFKESDVVVTATGKQDRPMVERDWLRQGGLYIGLESFRYWGEEALLSVDKFVTDDWNQAQSFLQNSVHIRTPPHLYGELSEIVINAKRGRETKDEQIVCIFVGMAIIDIAFGDLVYKMALEKGVGNELTLAQF